MFDIFVIHIMGNMLSLMTAYLLEVNGAVANLHNWLIDGDQYLPLP